MLSHEGAHTYRDPSDELWLASLDGGEEMYSFWVSPTTGLEAPLQTALEEVGRDFDELTQSEPIRIVRHTPPIAAEKYND